MWQAFSTGIESVWAISRGVISEFQAQLVIFHLPFSFFIELLQSTRIEGSIHPQNPEPCTISILLNEYVALLMAD